MYLLFRHLHWEPQRYFEMGASSRKVVAAFLRYYMDERNAELESIENELS